MLANKNKDLGFHSEKKILSLHEKNEIRMNGKNRLSVDPHRKDNWKVHCIDQTGDVDH